MVLLQEQRVAAICQGESYPALTICIYLIWIRHKSAVVPIIRNSVIVIVMVTGISFTIIVMVCLVSIGNIGTVIQVILMAILIYVLVIITLVSNQIIIHIRLKKKGH